MQQLLNRSIAEIMSKDVTKIDQNCLMSTIAKLFDTRGYHHLPVVNKDDEFIGMVSKSDYYKLQHHFTILKTGSYAIENDRLFSSLIAKDIMHRDLHTMSITNTIKDAIQAFLENRFHSLIIVDEGKCIGIITPHDIMKELIRLGS